MQNRRLFLGASAARTALSQKRVLGANDRIRVGGLAKIRFGPNAGEDLDHRKVPVKGVRHPTRILRTAMQQRNWEQFLTAVDLIGSVKIGKINRLWTYWNQPYTPRVPAEPEKLDCAPWLWSRPEQPYGTSAHTQALRSEQRVVAWPQS